MSPFEVVALAVAPILLGGLMYRYAYDIALLGELFDTIGSKTDARAVEPAEWKVLLTKGIAVMLVGIGVLLLSGVSYALIFQRGP